MVTLSEGPNHMAYFKGSEQEYDLSDETEVSIVSKVPCGDSSLLTYCIELARTLVTISFQDVLSSKGFGRSLYSSPMSVSN